MIASKLIEWYTPNKRNLPWRNTKNPYFIWLSEIILQQTRVEQGLPYYYQFLEKFNTIEELANSSEEKVLRTWQGLGYYSRGRNLHFTAKYISNELNGIFPGSYNELLKLKGVGKYTAAAIASFAFGEKVPAIDGNAIRVISRLFKIDEPVDSPKTLTRIFEISQELIKAVQPDLYNQAIMELGSQICTPKKPKCDQCPVQPNCLSFPDKSFNKIPFKAKRVKVIEREINYLVMQENGDYFLKQRGAGDIWQGLFDFPEINKEDKPELLNKLENGAFAELASVKHVLSHQKLSISFIGLKNPIQCLPQNTKIYNLEEIELLPKPKVISDFFKAFSSSES